ncbi:MAG: BNR repeat-containing protein [Verrucomicrobiae bacterium]|nr:BNR repeat-containing protein [Verrucomicrobiae bacterium]
MRMRWLVVTVCGALLPLSARDFAAETRPECCGVWYASGTANTLPGHRYVYSGPMATYSVWHRPMAVFAPAVNKTFFVYGNATNAPTISFYDHARRVFARPVVVGGNRDGDAHRNPTLHVAGDGHLYIFYGAHGHPTRVVKSAAAYDISAWIRKPDLPDEKTTYPQPWQLKAGELFVSWRGQPLSAVRESKDAAGQPPGWRFSVSRDGGSTWDAPTDLVRFQDATAYAITIAEEGAYPRKIHITWSRLGGGTEKEQKEKHLWARRYNVYYARSEDGGATWKRSDGTHYTLPITEAAAEKIYDSGQHGVWLKDIQLDPQGNPCILFIDADVATYASAWKFARHAGGRWDVSDVAASDHMYDDGGLVIRNPEDFRVYGPTTATQPQEDGGEIEEWRSSDGGKTWAHTRHITRGSPLSHNCVKVVFGHQRGPGDFQLLWSYGDSNYPPSTREVGMYFYGEARGEAARVVFPRGTATP